MIEADLEPTRLVRTQYAFGFETGVVLTYIKSLLIARKLQNFIQALEDHIRVRNVSSCILMIAVTTSILNVGSRTSANVTIKLMKRFGKHITLRFDFCEAQVMVLILNKGLQNLQSAMLCPSPRARQNFHETCLPYWERKHLLPPRAVHYPKFASTKNPSILFLKLGTGIKITNWFNSNPTLSQTVRVAIVFCIEQHCSFGSTTKHQHHDS